jgi:transcriptional regulator GlxA family with amidase domain
MTPRRWLTAQRLLEARRLLEATDLTVDEIARRCGLGTAANLRLNLARDAATTPSAYRSAFRDIAARPGPVLARRPDPVAPRAGR